MPYVHIVIAVFAVVFFVRGARIEEESPVLWGALSAGASLLVILLGGGRLGLLGGQLLVYALMFAKKLAKERKRERDGV